ncbi:11007_t:CDS:1, partial [Acaulospora colombiana]
YDMKGVRDVLKSTFLIPTAKDGDHSSLVQREALHSFIVAVTFDCLDEARFALREVIKCDWWSELERLKAFSIPLPLLHIVMVARAERKATLRLMADEIVRMPVVGLGFHEVTEELEDYLLERSHNLMKYLYLQIENQPSFERLKRAVCDTNFGALAEDVFRSRHVLSKLFARLEERELEAAAFEAELPDLLDLLYP